MENALVLLETKSLMEFARTVLGIVSTWMEYVSATMVIPLSMANAKSYLVQIQTMSMIQ